MINERDNENGVQKIRYVDKDTCETRKRVTLKDQCKSEGEGRVHDHQKGKCGTEKEVVGTVFSNYTTT